MHTHQLELGGRERSGLVQDLVREAHLPDVVEVGAEQDGRLRALLEAERPRHRHRDAGYALAMAEGAAVARLDRAPPFAHDRHVHTLQLRHLAAHVHYLDAGIEAAEQPVGAVEQPQGFLVAPHLLIQERELAAGLRFAQHRAGGDGQVERGAQPGLGERGATGLAVHRADHPIGVGFGSSRAQPVEQGERRLRALPGVLVALACHVDFGMIDETESLEVGVARPLGERPTLPEVTFRGGELAAVRAHHTEVVVRDGATVLIATVAVRRQGPLVAGAGLVQIALNVREDAEVLLYARAQLPARAPALERLQKRVAGLVERARHEIQATQRIQRLRRERVVTQPAGDVIAAAAQLAGLPRLVPLLVHDGEPPQRLGEHGSLPAVLRQSDRPLVAPDGVRDRPRALTLAGLAQQLGGGWRGLRPVGATRRWHKSRSAAADPSRAARGGYRSTG